MSGWIKMRTKLCTDPRVRVAAKKCGVSRNEMLGALFQLWCLADQHGGKLSAYDADMMDDEVRLKGFTNALPSDWIRVDDDGIVLPEYDEHNGSTAKRRALEAKRKADARKPSASDADKPQTKCVPRVDKSIKNLTTLSKPEPSAKKKYSDAFEKFWDFYPRAYRRGKADAYRQFKKLSKDEQHRATEHCELYGDIISKCVNDARRDFTPAASAWLHQGRWDSDTDDLIAEWCRHYDVRKPA